MTFPKKIFVEFYVDFLSTNDAPGHSQKRIFEFYVDFLSTNDAPGYSRFVDFLSTIHGEGLKAKFQKKKISGRYPF